MINENRHAIEHKLNYEITKDTKIDLINANRPCVHLKKKKKKKKTTLATESWENKKEVSTNRSMVHKSEVAKRKKAESPLA